MNRLIQEKTIPRILIIFIAIGAICLLVLGIFVARILLNVEPHLNPNGRAYEANLDDQGRLWISDYKSGEIWSVDSSSGQYEIYPVGGNPIDARQVNGWLWWADAQSNLLGLVSINDGSYLHWQVPDADGFLSTNIDSEGRLYATDSSNPYLYHLDPIASTVCAYTLPGFGASNYIVHEGDNLWLGDSFDSTIIQVDAGDDSITWWTLPPGSSPFGMAVDEKGSIWYADQGTKMLVRLDPSTNLLTGYLLPIGNYPQMIAIQSGFVWYTEQSQPSIGRLDPSSAAQETVALTVQHQQLTPSCSEIPPSESGNITITNGKLRLRQMDYSVIMNEAGWQIYQLPDQSDPWGIALAGHGFVVDSGRQRLISFNLP
jgi:streptogramin lyase